MHETPEDFLGDAANRAADNLVRLSVRELLALWGARRRGYWIVEHIKGELDKSGLTTRWTQGS